MAFEGWFLSYYLQLAVRIVIGMNSEASGWQLNRPIVPIWIIHWTKYKMFDCEPHRIGKYFFFVSVSKCACVMRVKCSNQTNHDKNIKKETKKKKKLNSGRSWPANYSTEESEFQIRIFKALFSLVPRKFLLIQSNCHRLFFLILINSLSVSSSNSICTSLT